MAGNHEAGGFVNSAVSMNIGIICIATTQYIYRPQRSWGKVIFSEACVKNSVHGGGGWYPSMHCRWYPSMPCRFPGSGIPACLAGLQAHTQGASRGVWPGGVSRPTPKGEVEGSGRGVSPGPHLGLFQHARRQTPPTPADSYRCGRCASYWNALYHHK